MQEKILKTIKDNKFNTYLICDKKIICIKKDKNNLYNLYIFNNKFKEFSNGLYNSNIIIEPINNLKQNELENYLNKYKTIKFISKNKAHKILKSYLDLFFKFYLENNVNQEELQRKALIKNIVDIVNNLKLDKKNKKNHFRRHKKHQLNKFKKSERYSKYIISKNKNCDLIGLRIKQDKFRYLYIYLNLPKDINQKIYVHKLSTSSYISVDEKIINENEFKSIVIKYLFENLFN